MKKSYALWLTLTISMFLPVFNLLSNQQKKADLIIFSYNRPMQLYALLESIEKYVKGIDRAIVIYRTSNPLYEKGYQIVKYQFSHHLYKQQGSAPKNDFKPLTLQALKELKNDYILFAVDDIIIKDLVDISDCIKHIEKHRAYGFYLRLGKNLTHCYSYNNAVQPLPPLQNVAPNVCMWQFSKGTYDWNYPHSVDMTLFKKDSISTLISSITFNTPNTLEGRLAGLSNAFKNQHGLCYDLSPIVNVPLNRVQNDWANKHMNFIQPSELLELFLHNKKIDIERLYKINNISAHMEYEPTFIERT